MKRTEQCVYLGGYVAFYNAMRDRLRSVIWELPSKEYYLLAVGGPIYKKLQQVPQALKGAIRDEL